MTAVRAPVSPVEEQAQADEGNEQAGDQPEPDFQFLPGYPGCCHGEPGDPAGAQGQDHNHQGVGDGRDQPQEQRINSPSPGNNQVGPHDALPVTRFQGMQKAQGKG